MFIYYNANPSGDKLPDCVIRALSLGLNVDYNVVIWMLEDIGDAFACDELCVDCYSKLLTEVFCFEEYDGGGKAVEQIAEENPYDIVLIRTHGHLTCAVSGIIFDIWDCSKEECDRYWIVDR